MQACMEMLETLLQGVRSACAAFPDKRRGEVTYSMADIGLSAFSLFFMQSESFLAHQRALEEGRKMSNCQSLFGMTAVPTDNHIRAMLDPVPPSHLQPAFDQTLDMLRRHGGLRAFQRLGGRVLIGHEDELMLGMFRDHRAHQHVGEAAITATICPRAGVNPYAHSSSLRPPTMPRVTKEDTARRELSEEFAWAVASA